MIPAENMGEVESFLCQMGWNYRPSGTDQFAVECCPFCSDPRWKFYISGQGDSQGLWTCHRCNEHGNLYQIKERTGHSITGVQSMKDTASRRHAPAPLPDFDLLHRNLMENEKYGEVLDFLVERGISLDTLKRMKIGAAAYKGKAGCGREGEIILTYVIPYFDAAGNATFFKARSASWDHKEFWAPSGREVPLINQAVLKPGMDELTLAEGEIDVASLISAGYDTVVGVPGANVQKTPWIEQIDKTAPKQIYLCLDSDDVGQKAARELAGKIGLDKVKNIVLPPFEVDGKPGKDLNDYFRAGHTLEDFLKLKESAKHYDVQGVQSLADVLDELALDIETKGNKRKYVTQYPSLNKKVGGGFDEGMLIGVIADAKCLTGDTYVNTPDGLQTITEVFAAAGVEISTSGSNHAYGSGQLMNRLGSMETVERYISAGEDTVYELWTRSGVRLKATSDHKFLVIEDGCLVWREVKDIKPGAFVASHRAYTFGSSIIPQQEAYALGVLIADGCFSTYNVKVSNDDPNIRQVIESTLPEMIGVEPCVYRRDNGSIMYEFNSSAAITSFYERYGLSRGTAKDKQLSEQLRCLDKDSTRALICGYMDCEASFGKAIEVTSASYTLMLQLKLILRGFGIEGYITEKHVRGYEGAYYRFTINGSVNLKAYLAEIGTWSQVRLRQINAQPIAQRLHSNVDILPTCKDLVERVYLESPSQRGRETLAKLARIIYTGQGLTYSILEWMMGRTWESPSFGKLRELHNTHYLFDEVVRVVPVGVERVYCFSLPESQSFIANGVVSHNCGKTTLVLNIMNYLAAQCGYPGYLWCGEMTQKMMVRKWVSMVTQTPDDRLTPQIIRGSAMDYARNMQSDMLFGMTKNEPKDVLDTIRQAHRRYGIKIAGIDNLQLLAVDSHHATQDTVNTATAIKALTLELDLLTFLIIQPKSVGQNEVVTANHAYLASAITKIVDYMLCAHRNRVAVVKADQLTGFMETEENFEPQLYIRTDLSRFSAGGWCTLYLDGATSTVRELGESEIVVPTGPTGLIQVEGSQEI